ncbi:DUF3999 domain-containing protein [Metabacillus sp. GX 13764]|uniref:DUF3999 family protein n=1 Tax=Metabacillus kandeliae TaxID=2900151 RepID=UPI001E60F79A|nr:DUF3999 family protein [Metabacillus kandeliae]MCD7035415.1 DUF3999 domain-containing protein [Metabacillus kandeliae]
MFHRISLILFLVLAAGRTLPAQAEEDFNKWKYYKPITFQAEGQYQFITLDEDIYAHAREDLGDLRIADNDGKPLPYYLKNSDKRTESETAAYSAKLVKSIQKKNSSINDFQILPLKMNQDIAGNTLQVQLPEGLFLKKISVWGSHDGTNWEPVTVDYLYRTDDAEKDTIPLGGTYPYGFYRLEIMENPEKLAFRGITLQHNLQKESIQDYFKQKTAETVIFQEGRNTVIDLKNNQKLRITKLTLYGEGNYKRSIEITDEKSLPVPIEGDSEIYKLSFKNQQYEKSTIELEHPVSSQELKIKIHNKDNAPLKIPSVVMDYTVDQLVFEGKGARLYYGNLKASKPDYDIASFRQLVDEEEPVQALLGNETARTVSHSAVPGEQPKWIFNLIIGAVSLLLIVLLLRKMQGASKKSMD